MSAFLRRAWRALLLCSAVLSLAQAAFLPFENCLSPNTINKRPLQLQWVPLFVDAKFDTQSPNNLRLTFYGNVTGQAVEGPYPPPSAPSWQNDSDHFGKITNVGSGHKLATLFSSFQVLSYNAWGGDRSRFCSHVTQGDCPLGPRFDANPNDPADLAAFELHHEFHSAYQFSTLASEVWLISGDKAAQRLACISTNITPDLGASISAMLTWLPAAILILKGIATLAAAIWSPWGSSDIFRWSSNYGRDEDLLRLVTPGFGDCLQYIQFVTLMGSLTLQYPGFFQPAVSETAWSLLLFNQSWVTDGPGTQSLQDGIYTANGTYGISTMRQLVGMTDSIDVWACMAIWLAVIAAIIIVLTQVGFFIRWLHRIITNTSEEDLRQKNLPFTLGNMIRLLFNFFILPIIALSLFQLVISPRSPKSVVAVAALLLATWIISAAWILRVIFSTKPRTHLFDDMPTVLLYGPLYNTYSDSAAPFAFIPILITFMRGIAFGAAQPSGTAQVIILAICEIVLIVTLNGFRPFMNQTSMNAYHTFFAAARLITVLLSITFIDSLNVGESPRGWIGYTILIIHACVLVFGFFLSSAQTIVELIARSMGVGGQTRGSILNWRMLKKRQDRPGTADRNSMGSHPDMMRDADGHGRSMSASSQQLLNQAGGNTPSSHRTSGLDNLSNAGEVGDSPNMGYTYVPVGLGGQGQMQQGKTEGKREGEMFYRPPRKRTMTNEMLGPVKESRSEDSPRHAIAASIARSGTDSPRPAFFRDRADSGAVSVRTDYAVREVDQYYRGPALNEQQTRKLKTGPADPEGPAASAQTWFQGLWFGLLGRKKKKEKDVGKGFEVMRSSRMPLDMQQEIVRQEQEELEMQDKSRPEDDEPYRDSPEMRQEDLQASAGAERTTSGLSEVSATRSPVEAAAIVPSRSKEAFDFGFDRRSESENATREMRTDSATAGNASTRSRDLDHPGVRAEQPSRRPKQRKQANVSSYDIGPGYITPTRASGEQAGYNDEEHEEFGASNRFSDLAPSLEPVDLGDDLNLPTFSRFASQRSGTPLFQPDTMESFDANQEFLDDNEEEERPSSFFNTSYHRAGDSITRNSFGASAALQGSSAEIVPGSFQTDDGGGGFLRRESRE